MSLKSCIYQGTLFHHRFLPRENKFTYTVFFLYLDLEELDQVFAGRWFWSAAQPNVAYFKRADYLGPVTVPLAQAVAERVEQKLGERPEGPIRLLTHLRYFGHCFNPVSFYYCYNRAGTEVDYIVAEITNTPWRERHSYVLDCRGKGGGNSEMHFSFNKGFHVSPFMDMDFRYDWYFREPGSLLYVHMDNSKKQSRYFEATLKMQRREISGPALAWMLVRFPAMTLRVLSMIYWQAFRLWLKKIPYYEHPKYYEKRKS